MLRKRYLSFFDLLRSFFKLMLLSLVLLMGARIYLFVTYSSTHFNDFFELSQAFWLGFRLDLSITSYIVLVPLLFVFLVSVVRLWRLQRYMLLLVKIYFIGVFTFLSFLIFADLVYFLFLASMLLLSFLV